MGRDWRHWTTLTRLADVLGERKRLLLEAVEQSQPDVLLVEHFPISKWVLHEEILAVIAAGTREPWSQGGLFPA